MEKKEMGEITKLALRTINDELSLSFEQSMPTAILDYLADNEDPIVIHDFIKTGEIFMNLSNLIKRTMIESGACKENATESDFCDCLHNLMSKQSYECWNYQYEDYIYYPFEKYDSESIKKKTKRWLDGTTKSIRFRHEAIEICFALKLDINGTKNFLNKCGFVGLNIRNPEDATFYYCILNHRPLYTAIDLINRYYKATIKHKQTTDSPIEHSGQTTMFLEKGILEYSNWEDDTSFLKTFLIHNKEKFIGYATSSLKEYYILKNKLFLTIIFDRLLNESDGLINYLQYKKEKKEEEKRDRQDHIYYYRFSSPKSEAAKDIPISLALKSALRKYDDNVKNFINLLEQDDDSKHKLSDCFFKILHNRKQNLVVSEIYDMIPKEELSQGILLLSDSTLCSIKKRNNTIFDLCKANSLLQDNMLNEIDVFKQIINSFYNNQEIESQKQLSLFLTDIIKTEGLLKYTIKSIVDKNTNRLRKRTDSSLHNTIMKEFPTDKSFVNFEKDPTIISNGMTVRKMIILMYFIIYSYEYTRNIEVFSNDKLDYEDTPESMIVEEYAFDEFTTKLNKILELCRLPLLYPANQFDWLILRCVRQLEIYDFEEYDDVTAETLEEQDDSPIAFFNAIIRYSFKKEDTE